MLPSTISCQKLARPLLSSVVLSSGKNSLKILASPFCSNTWQWQAISAITNNSTFIMKMIPMQSLLFNTNPNKLWCKSTTNPVPMLRIAALRSFSELTKNVTRLSHGHCTPSLKISCKSVHRFARNVADNEISIAASRSFSELTQKWIRSSHGHSAPSLKISCKSVQPFSRNLANKETKKKKKQTNQSKTIPHPLMYRGWGNNTIMQYNSS